MKVLIAEDVKKNIEDAIRIIGNIAKENGIDLQIITATTVHDTYGKMDGVDGVISDVYMPLSSERPWNHSDSPCGINVVARAMDRGIPSIFCTSGDHHGPTLEWLNILTRNGALGLPDMVDGCGPDTDTREKDWGQAFTKLYRKITGITLSSEKGLVAIRRR